MVISIILLVMGCLIAFILFGYAIARDREFKFIKQRRFAAYGIAEAIVYFLCAWGFPDFVMNTLILKKLRWVDTENLPPTLIACAATPGAFIAFSYLQGTDAIDLKTILICVAAIIAGVLAGGRCAGAIPVHTLKMVMRIALSISVIALIIRMILQSGTIGSGTTLSSKQLLIAVPFVFLFGFINMFGVPMKPSATVLFLLLGLSPLSTLTLMLILGCVSPLIGSVKVIRDQHYNTSLSVAAVIFGTIGAVIGTRLTIQIPQVILNIILIVMMCFAIACLDHKSKN